MVARLKDVISYLNNYSNKVAVYKEGYSFKHNLFFKKKTFHLPDDEEVPFRRKDFFANLLFECGDMFIITDDPYSLCVLVKSWSKERVPYWQRMYDALLLDYNPLTNWDMTINQNDKLDRTDSDLAKDTGERLDRVAGYDSGELVDNAQSTTSRELDDSFKRDDNKDTARTEVGRKYKSAQSLVMEELQLAQISLYDIILNEFKQKFCIMLFD